MYVKQAIAEKYATKLWPVWRIKGAHNLHRHYVEGKGYVKGRPCPNCSYCRCPVPFHEHSRH